MAEMTTRMDSQLNLQLREFHIGHIYHKVLPHCICYWSEKNRQEASADSDRKVAILNLSDEDDMSVSGKCRIQI